jgi:CubicO group peptidase (beta-lactamase class C family)
MALELTVDPSEVGIDADRLPRIDAVCQSYIDSGKFAGAQFVLTRRGEIVHQFLGGHADVERGRELRDDTIFRIFSMTKPITSVALMMLYESGALLLEDPVSMYIPEFADTRIWVSGDTTNYQTRAPERQITVKDVLTHTSGLTYGFQHFHTVDALYREDSLGDFGGADYTLEEAMVLLAKKPLLFEPGTGWNYSMSTDVCGAIVAAASGMPLDQFFAERIFSPLGMIDTGFHAEGADRHERLPTNYLYMNGTKLPFDQWETSSYRKPPTFLSGGGGLVSTTADYNQFTQMLLRGGELDGQRLLSPRTVDYMTMNHLPGNRTLNEMGQTGFSEASMGGLGFGLGFSVNLDPAENGALSSMGTYGWGGAASTVFSIDPREELSFTFMTQLLPSSTYPIRRQLQAAVYQSLID